MVDAVGRASNMGHPEGKCGDSDSSSQNDDRWRRNDEQQGGLLVRQLLGFCGGEAFVDLVPVDDVPPCGEVVGAAVLVLQVVGVLPDVVAEDGVEAAGEGRVLVGGGDDLEFAALEDEPAPAGAELLGGGLVELLLGEEGRSRWRGASPGGGW